VRDDGVCWVREEVDVCECDGKKAGLKPIGTVGRKLCLGGRKRLRPKKSAKSLERETLFGD
jgi:hypothetical protein